MVRCVNGHACEHGSRRADVRGREVDCDHLEDVGVRHSGIVESGGVDQSNRSFEEIECVRGLHPLRTRPKTLSDSEIGFAQKVDELLEYVSQYLSILEDTTDSGFS